MEAEQPQGAGPKSSPPQLPRQGLPSSLSKGPAAKSFQLFVYLGSRLLTMGVGCREEGPWRLCGMELGGAWGPTPLLEMLGCWGALLPPTPSQLQADRRRGHTGLCGCRRWGEGKGLRLD